MPEAIVRIFDTAHDPEGINWSFAVNGIGGRVYVVAGPGFEVAFCNTGGEFVCSSAELRFEVLPGKELKAIWGRETAVVWRYGDGSTMDVFIRTLHQKGAHETEGKRFVSNFAARMTKIKEEHLS